MCTQRRLQDPQVSRGAGVQVWHRPYPCRQRSCCHLFSVTSKTICRPQNGKSHDVCRSRYGRSGCSAAVGSCGHETWSGLWEEVSTTMWLLGAMSGLVNSTMLAARAPLKKCKSRHSTKTAEKQGSYIMGLLLYHNTYDVRSGARKIKKIQFSKWASDNNVLIYVSLVVKYLEYFRRI